MSPPSDKNVGFPPGLGVGDVVGGRYRLEYPLGQGGMGVVVAAHHLELDERVAVKFLSSNALTDPEAVARFDREIRTAARLKNEHVARVYDAGKLPDGGRFMVLEFLDGEDLAARVRRTGTLPPTLAVRFLLQACSAVLEAHGRGIIHRDLKPANIYVVKRADGSEIVKVLDFGVMKRLPGGPVTADTQQTEPGTIVGTPFYTSPEQLRGSADVDVRTDIWSLGATLFELIAGTPPFSGKTYPQIIANVLESTPRSLESCAPDLPEGLAQVIYKCLKKDPADRYENVADLAAALADTVELDSEQKGLLERIVRHGLVSSPFSSPSALATPRSSRSRLLGAATPSIKQYQSTARRRKRLQVVAGVATLSAIAVVALGLPFLPKFSGPKPPPLSASLLLPQAPPLVLPSIPPSAVISSPTALSPTLSNPPQKPPVRSVVTRPTSKTSGTASTNPTVEVPASAVSETSSVRKKNPLLVRPR